MAYVNIFSNPYTSTESWSAQGAVVRFGLESLQGGFVDWNSIFQGGSGDTAACSGYGAKEGAVCPLIIAGIDLRFARQSQQIYPLNADKEGQAKKVSIKGAPQGTLNITSIYSPVAKSIACFLALASRDCVSAGNEMWMTLRPFGSITCTTDKGGQTISADEAKKITWRISGVELNQLGLQMQSGQVTVVNMPLSFEFTDLKISDDGNFGSLKG